MKDCEEEHMLFTHQDRKLEAVFIHRPETDTKRAKELSDFFIQMQGAFQRFIETSDYFNEKTDKLEESTKKIE